VQASDRRNPGCRWLRTGSTNIFGVAQLTFLGAARTVTGSKYLVEHAGRRVLVDCGLFQGLKELRERNWEPFPVPARSIHAIVLTHAHLDHVGYLPRLVAQGFKDSAKIQEEDARQANKHGYSKHAPALPLYTEIEAQRALTMLQPMGYQRAIEAAPGISVEFLPAGHLLGSAFVVMRLDSGPTILFGGDLGRYGRPVLPDPLPAVQADVVLVESTYGDRDHPEDDGGAGLAAVIRDTASRGGKLIVPAFAIGRVEELLYWVRLLERQKQIPVLPVYVDSPMATEALRHYIARVGELDPDMKTARADVSTFATARFQTIASPQQSKELTASRRSAIVISASGMATGGRVLHHMAAALPDPRNTVLFVGFQAPGTRGRALVDGAREVRIHGQAIAVNAQIARNDSMSAHADRGEIMRWLGTLPAAPRRLCLVHGEPGAMDALKHRIVERLGWEVSTPAHREAINL
jgi:metallo-beta-lactamase family protein